MSMLLSGGEVFSLAMEIEKSGNAFYRTVAGMTRHAELAELFGFLAAEETRHLEFFRSLQRELGDFTVDRDEWEETSRYIRATTEGRFFVGEDRAILAARGVGSVREALDVAVGFEKDTLLFFHELLAVTPALSQDAARRIVDEEKRHVLMLSERRAALAR
jgi:rubrerythrin